MGARIWWRVSVTGLLLWAGSLSAQSLQFNGSTMGTYYRVLYRYEVGAAVVPLPELRQRLEASLQRVNQQMSTYIADSELSLFNKAGAGKWVPVSAETAQVVADALELTKASDGVFDVTIGRLVNLWGFGPDGRPAQIPSREAIAKARQQGNSQQLEVRLQPPALRKSNPAVYVDLSGFAKGYGVDAMAAVLEKAHCRNYLVEIGGEIRVRGSKRHGLPWRVAIEQKQPLELQLSQGAIATSGNYRNYFWHDGRRYSHLIDPRSGWPVDHGTVSATVIAETSQASDGWATAMMVLGKDQGLALARKHGLAVYFVTRDAKGVERAFHSPAMATYLPAGRS